MGNNIDFSHVTSFKINNKNVTKLEINGVEVWKLNSEPHYFTLGTSKLGGSSVLK